MADVSKYEQGYRDRTRAAARAAETRAAQARDTAPRCARCGAPMMLGQRGHHFSCCPRRDPQGRCCQTV